jgi:hypothetical protein
MNRRSFLRAGGACLALPWLGRTASATTSGAPKRFVILHNPQGTVMRDWIPTGSASNFTFGPITAPLAPFQDRLVVVSGVDNVMPRYNSVGNAHVNANYTFLTGRPFPVQDGSAITGGGPSIEQVLASRISTDTPFPRLDFAIGGRSTGSGFFTPTEGTYFWVDRADPVSYFNDPVLTTLRIFGDSSVPAADRWAERARRSSVLAAVLDNFDVARRDLGASDRVRLDAHADKLVDLEARIASGTGSCVSPTIALPPGYTPTGSDDASAPAMTEILVTALACDMTRVATLHFAEGHAPTFPWLTARNGGSPIVDPGLWENWHAMVHADYQPGMELAYTWYMEQFAHVLRRMSETTDADGDNLLDTSLVMLVSEYSSGRHWNRHLPVILAGCVGDAPLGRWLDLRPGSVDDYEARNGYLDSGYTMNQLLVSILHAFGFDDADFGFTAPELPSGPLPGLL